MESALEHFFKPEEDSSLTPVKLAELVDKDWIIYPAECNECEQHRKELERMSEPFTLYVDKETNLALPLRMKLSLTWGDMLILSPNQPVAALVYEIVFKTIWFPDEALQGLQPFNMNKNPFKFRLNNRGSYDSGKKSIFPKHEMGWKSDKQGKPLETRVNIEYRLSEDKDETTPAWERQVMHTKVRYVARYQI